MPHMVPVSGAAEYGQAVAGRVLAEVRYGIAVPGAADHLIIPVPMQQLGVACSEFWVSRQSVAGGAAHGIRYAHDDSILFGVATLPHTDSGAEFEAMVADAYERITACVAQAGFPNLQRIWNYFGGIHERFDRLDRYQLFCRARYAPLRRHCESVGDAFPAATAVGWLAKGGVIYVLAAKKPGHHQENPRQVSAFHYPDIYGPQSPSFARATLSRVGNEAALYISGTASIVGHESRHAENIDAQFNEALANVTEVIRTAGRASGTAMHGLEQLALAKVYLRPGGDAMAITARARSAWGAIPMMVIQGELCRSELLVEIEGLATPG